MSTSKAPKRSRASLWTWICAVGALVLAGAYVLVAWLTGRVMPQDATIAGVDVGGMSAEDARGTLDRELGDRAAQPLVLTAGDQEATLEPSEAGLALDSAASVERAIGFTVDPRIVWDRITGSHDLDPVIAVDDAAFDPVAAQTAEDLSTEPSDASLAFDDEGAAQVTEGADGQVVTADSMREAIGAQWLRSDDAIALEPDAVEPDITTAEAEQAKTDIADPAVSGDVVLSAKGEDGADDGELTVSPEVISSTLAFEPKDSALAPVFDPKKLREEVLDDNEDVGERAKDASYEIRDGKPVVVPAEDGVGVDEEKLAEVVATAMVADDRSGEVDLTVEKPEFTTEDAEKADVSAVISEFSTSYSSSPNRDTNLRVASDKVSGTVLKPGEQFSLNDTLGQRTAANGYKPAGVISGGQMKEDFGGGVSQVSTTLFNAAYFAGFQLDEHRAHSRYISRYPEGRETTLDWRSIDLKFTNTSDTPVVLDMYLSGGQVHARVFGVKTVDVESSSSDRFAFTSPSTIRESGSQCKPQSPKQGWSITIKRTIRKHGSGEVVDRDQFTTVYRPVNKVVCD